MENVTKELEDWLSNRSLWLQHATNKILQGRVDEKDIDDFVNICKKEVEIDSEITIDPLKLKRGKIRNGEENIDLIVESFSDIKGINALSPRNPLELDKNLNIIYGQNGSGKSSYVRLFKHLSGSKNSGSLYGNVYKEQTEQSCKIKYNINGENREVNWDSNQGSLEDFIHIEIYDSDDAYTYINHENEVTYEPVILSLISELIELCNRVKMKLNQEVEGNVSVLPSIPKKYANTESGKWLEKINHKTSLKEVREICGWDSELEKEFDELTTRLNEVNPLEKAKVVRKNIRNINQVVTTINDLFLNFSNEKCQLIHDTKQEAESKRKAAEDDAEKVFRNAPINTINNESWRLLWEQARKFSETYAYKDERFPNVEKGALCVLCQQPLEDDAVGRLVSFEEYVQGNLEKQAKETEDTLQKLIDNLPKIPDIESFSFMLDSAGIHEQENRNQLISILEDIKHRKDDLLGFKNIEDIKHLPEHDIISYLKDKKVSLEKQVELIEKDAKEENKEKLREQKINLEAKKWLSEQKDNVVEEVHRIIKVKKLEEAVKLTNTQALSTKKSVLSEKLITEAYVKRFKRELQILGASYINIKLVKTRAHKGQIFHEIKLSNPKRNVKTAEVLSEGEQRIVSFAAFLADINGKQVNSPLILDDPISSLDQEYEEAIVKRLVELSITKQLIVFTHRISLLTLLEEAAKSINVKAKVVGVSREYWGAGELGGTPLFAKKPDSALNIIYNERLPKAQKILEEIGREEYTPIAKGICSDFRIILERTIETYLLSDIVKRFRRSITTMGRINNLYKIEQSDCEMFDKYMTKYSRYEHSQPAEAPVSIPEPQELKDDIELIMSWIKEFKKR